MPDGHAASPNIGRKGSKQRRDDGFNRNKSGQISNSANDKNQYYRFYLDNAQKAINLMIEQHRSASQVRLLEFHKQQSQDMQSNT